MRYKFEDIIYNITEKKKPTEEDRLNYIGLEHLDSGSLFVSRWGSDVTPEGEKIIMKKGDVLFGKRRAYQKKVAISPIDGIFSAHGMVLRPKENVICKEYLPFFISSDYFLNEAIRISVGGLSPTINWKDIKVLEFDLPSLSEQKLLAEKLWAAYKVKQSYIKMIEATDEMVKSQFIEMFGDSTSSAKWPSKSLSEIVDPACPISYGIVQPGDEVEDGIPIVRPVDLNPNFYIYKEGLKRTTEEISNSYKRTILRGDELLLCVRGTTGLMGLATDEIKGGNVTRGITPLYFKPGFNRFYLLGAFLSDEVQKYIKDNTVGSTLKGINMEKVRKIQIPIPPIELQNRWECIFKQADKSKFELRKSIEAIDKVIKSLINENL